MIGKADPKFRLRVGITNTEKALEVDSGNDELKQQLDAMKAKLAQLEAAEQSGGESA